MGACTDGPRDRRSSGLQRPTCLPAYPRPHEPTRPRAYPHPAASPRITPATSQIAAAVVRPLSESSPWCFCLLFWWLGPRARTTPAPMKPTPLATCAAARALSENSSLPTPGRLGSGCGLGAWVHVQVGAGSVGRAGHTGEECGAHAHH